MMKVVLNKSFGVFNISNEASKLLNLNLNIYLDPDEVRTRQDLIGLIESKGSFFVSGSGSRLVVAEIPDNCEFHISDYDGVESIKLFAIRSEVVRLASEPDNLVKYLEGCQVFKKK